ncbi:vesicle-associated membrane protein-associated protein [Anaeramoeba ignava]|uniref:Vesicle-associated membrane protein-associated protein n=1 Tax=Anaeramoeba ignava TaxID=1746090 RepID=A0A9Q0LG26_ANAIG|nr:vesicle-associated membrane protein-associated protein [Anaeramoeba ignava]
MLSINPTVLNLPYSFNEYLLSSTFIQNKSSQKIIFKIKTTSPQTYFIKPHIGILSPNQIEEIFILFSPSIKSKRKSDQFLIQFHEIDLPDSSQINEDLISNQFSKISSQDLKLNYFQIIFAKRQFQNSQIEQLQHQLAKSQLQNSKLFRKIVHLEEKIKNMRKSSKKFNQMGILLFLFIILVAFYYIYQFKFNNQI